MNKMDLNLWKLPTLYKGDHSGFLAKGTIKNLCNSFWFLLSQSSDVVVGFLKTVLTKQITSLKTGSRPQVRGQSPRQITKKALQTQV